MRSPIALALLALPAIAGAQGGTVAPGMTRAQVVAALGAPVTARSAGDHTYLFYPNECGRRCGMNDLVVLRRDSVVDAIFRSAARRYTGTSSSPAPLSGDEARHRATAPLEVPMRRSAAAATVPTRATGSPAAAAAPRRQASAADRARLRQELLGAGLTATEIRARLRAEGYPGDLLDADMHRAASTSPPTSPAMRPGAPNDTRPSIPTPEPLRPAGAPAPASTPATRPVPPSPPSRPPTP